MAVLTKYMLGVLFSYFRAPETEKETSRKSALRVVPLRMRAVRHIEYNF